MLSCLRLATVLSVAVFVVLWGVSMTVYPGGNFFDRSADGYDFLRNFLCDSLHSPALDGRPNRLGAAAMTAAMLTLVFGLTCSWLLLPVITRGRAALGRGARSAGVLAMAAAAVVPVLPSDRYPLAHGIIVVVAAGGCVVAGGLAIIAVADDEAPPRTHTALGLATLASVVGDAGLYIHTQYLGGTLSVALPALQKAATVLVLAWMLAVACRASAASAPNAG